MPSSLDHFKLGLLFLAIFLPSSFERSVSTRPQTSNKNYDSDESVEVPMISTGEGSSRIQLVPLQFGEPPQTLHLIPDTGSDATWVYCDRLRRRRHSNSSLPSYVFGHSRSATFAPVSCSSTHCSNTTRCSSMSDLCTYALEYYDGTFTAGFWARDTVTICDGSSDGFKFRAVMIGCSSPDATNLVDADGILGLAPNYPSFTHHLSSKHGFMLSYSLSNDDGVQNPSRLVFGRATRRSAFKGEEPMQYTKLVTNADPYFFVDVTNLFVDGVPLDIPRWVWKLDEQNASGGVILDTGTVYTYVPELAFLAVRSLYAEFFRPYDRVTVTSSDLCFDPSDPELDGARIPALAIEFEDGARFFPDVENLFYEDEEGVDCLAIRAINQSDGSIIGSRLQTGFFWEYDLLNQRVGFAPLSH